MWKIRKWFEKKSVSKKEYDEEKREFENYLSSHPEKQNDLKLFSKTLLKADTNITFTNKSKLYKKPKGRVVLFWASRVAAVLVLAFAIFSLLDKNVDTVNNDNRVAQVEKTQKQPEIPQAETLKEVAKEEIQLPEKKAEQLTKETTTSQKQKKVTPKQESPKNIQEKTEEPVQEEKEILLREPIESLAELQPIMASMEIKQPKVGLAPASLRYIEIIIEEPATDDERLLADVVKEKTGIDKLSLNKIKKAGLNLVSNFTKDNLSPTGIGWAVLGLFLIWGS